MRGTEHLINAWPGIIDLSPLKDVDGKRLVFQPAGLRGSEREVNVELLEHPHVERFLKARWLHRKTAAVAVPALVATPPHADSTAPIVEPTKRALTVPDAPKTTPQPDGPTVKIELRPSSEAVLVAPLEQPASPVASTSNEPVIPSPTVEDTTAPTEEVVVPPEEASAPTNAATNEPAASVVPESRGRKRR